jgi:hypothetical protein
VPWAGGTALNYLEPHFLGRAALVVSLSFAVLGVTAIAVGAWEVVQETRLSYDLLREDTAEVLASLRSPLLSGDGQVEKSKEITSPGK